MEFNSRFRVACDLTITALANRTSETPAIKMLVEVCAELNRSSSPSEIKRIEGSREDICHGQTGEALNQLQEEQTSQLKRFLFRCNLSQGKKLR
jgi:hypothetical protein